MAFDGNGTKNEFMESVTQTAELYAEHYPEARRDDVQQTFIQGMERLYNYDTQASTKDEIVDCKIGMLEVLHIRERFVQSTQNATTENDFWESFGLGSTVYAVLSDDRGRDLSRDEIGAVAAFYDTEYNWEKDDDKEHFYANYIDDEEKGPDLLPPDDAVIAEYEKYYGKLRPDTTEQPDTVEVGESNAQPTDIDAQPTPPSENDKTSTDAPATEDIMNRIEQVMADKSFVARQFERAYPDDPQGARLAAIESIKQEVLGGSDVGTAFEKVTHDHFGLPSMPNEKESIALTPKDIEEVKHRVDTMFEKGGKLDALYQERREGSAEYIKNTDLNKIKANIDRGVSPQVALGWAINAKENPLMSREDAQEFKNALSQPVENWPKDMTAQADAADVEAPQDRIETVPEEPTPDISMSEENRISFNAEKESAEQYFSGVKAEVETAYAENGIGAAAMEKFYDGQDVSPTTADIWKETTTKCMLSGMTGEEAVAKTAELVGAVRDSNVDIEMLRTLDYERIFDEKGQTAEAVVDINKADVSFDFRPPERIVTDTEIRIYRLSDEDINKITDQKGFVAQAIEKRLESIHGEVTPSMLKSAIGDFKEYLYSRVESMKNDTCSGQILESAVLEKNIMSKEEFEKEIDNYSSIVVQRNEDGRPINAIDIDKSLRISGDVVRSHGHNLDAAAQKDPKMREYLARMFEKVGGKESFNSNDFYKSRALLQLYTRAFTHGYQIDGKSVGPLKVVLCFGAWLGSDYWQSKMDRLADAVTRDPVEERGVSIENADIDRIVSARDMIDASVADAKIEAEPIEDTGVAINDSDAKVDTDSVDAVQNTDADAAVTDESNPLEQEPTAQEAAVDNAEEDKDPIAAEEQDLKDVDAKEQNGVETDQTTSDVSKDDDAPVTSEEEPEESIDTEDQADVEAPPADVSEEADIETTDDSARDAEPDEKDGESRESAVDTIQDHPTETEHDPVSGDDAQDVEKLEPDEATAPDADTQADVENAEDVEVDTTQDIEAPNDNTTDGDDSVESAQPQSDIDEDGSPVEDSAQENDVTDEPVDESALDEPSVDDDADIDYDDIEIPGEEDIASDPVDGVTDSDMVYAAAGAEQIEEEDGKTDLERYADVKEREAKNSTGRVEQPEREQDATEKKESEADKHEPNDTEVRSGDESKDDKRPMDDTAQDNNDVITEDQPFDADHVMYEVDGRVFISDEVAPQAVEDTVPHSYTDIVEGKETFDSVYGDDWQSAVRDFAFDETTLDGFAFPEDASTAAERLSDLAMAYPNVDFSEITDAYYSHMEETYDFIRDNRPEMHEILSLYNINDYVGSLSTWVVEPARDMYEPRHEEYLRNPFSLDDVPPEPVAMEVGADGELIEALSNGAGEPIERMEAMQDQEGYNGTPAIGGYEEVGEINPGAAETAFAQVGGALTANAALLDFENPAQLDTGVMNEIANDPMEATPGADTEVSQANDMERIEAAPAVATPEEFSHFDVTAPASEVDANLKNTTEIEPVDLPETTNADVAMDTIQSHAEMEQPDADAVQDQIATAVDQAAAIDAQQHDDTLMQNNNDTTIQANDFSPDAPNDIDNDSYEDSVGGHKDY